MLLSGNIGIKRNLSENVEAVIPTVSFQQVELSNRFPYFSPGTWGFPISIGSKFAGFELGFRNIAMVEDSSGYPALLFDVHLQVSDDTTKLRATGGFSLLGEMVVVDGEQHWRHKQLKIRRIEINGSFSGVATVQGFAHWFEGHQVYGTGFRGGLKAKFEMMNSEVNVVGQFGRVNGYKYFMIDAMYCAGPGGGVNLGGAFELNGIGGGVFYHMQRPNSAVSFSSCGTPISPALGASLSGIIYTPTDTVLLGIKLTIAGATVGSSEAFNANASLEFQFGPGGSLDKIWLYGNGRFMAPIDIDALPTFVKDQLPNNNAAVSANVEIVLDFEHQQFSGHLETYMNVAGVLMGTGPNNRVCHASVKFSESDWYIKIGGPHDTARVGIKLLVPGTKEPLLTFTSYLQIGKGIDPMPALPQDILQIISAGDQSQYSSSRLTGDQLQGFAFGADVRLGGHYTFSVLYADLDAHLGFDINVAKAVPPMLCNGHEFGINGWYAQGQIYAALGVDMGIEVKVFGSKQKFTVLRGQVGAALETRMPNPFWAHGAIGYSYNLLEGLVSGEGNFDFEIGEMCVFSAQGSLADVPVILDARPGEGTTNVRISDFMEATFNFPVGEEFSFEDIGGSSNVFKVSLDTLKIYWRGYEIPTRAPVFTSNLKKVRLVPNAFLPGNDTIRFLVSVHVDSNGVTIDRERKDVWFVTGDGIQTIVPNNVLGSYPLDGQYNFYRDELTNRTGYIQLDRAQPDVMIEEDEYVKVVRFRQRNGACWSQILEIETQNYFDRRLEFSLPPEGFLSAGNLYEMQIVDYPRNDPNWGPEMDGPAPCLCNGCLPVTITPEPPFGSVLSPIPTAIETPPPAPANTTPLTERIVYSAYFRASQYARFSDKIIALQGNINVPGQTRFQPDEQVFGHLPDVAEFNIEIEPFDWYDKIQVNRPQVQIFSNYNGTTNNWFSGLPYAWQFPILNPESTSLNFPDESVMYVAGYGQQQVNNLLNNSVVFTNANNTDLRITKIHFISGLPNNFTSGGQKLLVAAGGNIDNYTAGFRSEFASHMTIDNEAYVLEDCPLGPCDCSSTDWVTLRHLMCAQSATAPFYFPIRFKYTLPGTTQVTGDCTAHLIYD